MKWRLTFSNKELEEYKRYLENEAKRYHIAIFKNHDYTSEIDRLKMLAVYKAYMNDLRDIVWELECRELGIF